MINEQTLLFTHLLTSVMATKITKYKQIRKRTRLYAIVIEASTMGGRLFIWLNLIFAIEVMYLKVLILAAVDVGGLWWWSVYQCIDNLGPYQAFGLLLGLLLGQSIQMHKVQIIENVLCCNFPL